MRAQNKPIPSQNVPHMVLPSEVDNIYMYICITYLTDVTFQLFRATSLDYVSNV